MTNGAFPVVICFLLLRRYFLGYVCKYPVICYSCTVAAMEPETLKRAS